MDVRSETITGSFGIDEPINGEPVQFSQHDVVLVPLVAFDGTGQRLGQGAASTTVPSPLPAPAGHC